jgi:hypothetical protein
MGLPGKPPRMSALDNNYDVALDTAATAVAGLRPAVDALEEIAHLNSMCPLAAEIALRGLREVKAVIATELATDHYERQLEEAMARVDIPRFDAEVERLDARVAAEQDSDRMARS